MSTIRVVSILRCVLVADAVASAGTGLLTLLGAAALAPVLGLPLPLLRGVGAVLVPYAALVYVLSRRDVLRRRVVWVLAGVNALWVVESLGLLESGWVAPTALGVGFVVVQAAVVAGFAAAQVHVLRRGGETVLQPAE